MVVELFYVEYKSKMCLMKKLHVQAVINASESRCADIEIIFEKSFFKIVNDLRENSVFFYLIFSH